MDIDYLLVLSGNNPKPPFSDNVTVSRASVSFRCTGDKEVLLVPSKEKTTVVYSDESARRIADDVMELDSSRLPYSTTLDTLAARHGSFVLDTTATSSQHRCVSVHEDNISLTGVVDTLANSTYLCVTNTDMVQQMISKEPMRYFVYRFAAPQAPVMLHTEILCSKWYRWRKDMDNLSSFNALERRLYKRPDTL